MTDLGYMPCARDVAVRSSLAALYSGADLAEARAFLDQLEDRGYRVVPSQEHTK